MKGDRLWFESSHGTVPAERWECVSLTYGASEKCLPHTPVMSGGVCKSLTTLCGHDIGVVVEDED